MKNIITVIVALFITTASFAQSKDIAQAQVDLQKTFNTIKATSARCKKAPAVTKIHEERGSLAINWDHKMEIANGMVIFSFHKFANDFQQITYNFNIGKETFIQSEDDSYKTSGAVTTLDCFTSKHMIDCRDGVTPNINKLMGFTLVSEDDDTQTLEDQKNSVGCAVDMLNAWVGFWKAEAKFFGK